MVTYKAELTRAMTDLARDPRTFFLGQAVVHPGTGMTETFAGVAPTRLLEMPVAEDLQMGMAIGMSLAGFLPVCIFPRFNFLLLAMNQLVLHLDKLPRFSGYRPHVIIRTAVATNQPMDPGPQHLGDFTEPLRAMLDTVKVVRLDNAASIGREYENARKRPGSTLLVERVELY